VRVTIAARQCEIADHLRDRARELVSRLERVAPRVHSARVTFAEDHGESVVELELRGARGAVHVARGAGPDHRSALDRAAQRMRRQAGRVPARRRALQRQPR
jgi:ribosome-associated translation inhibitor RaiA